MGWEALALLWAAGFFGGLVDAIAGGGGLLSLPVLLWAGLSPAQALGTNKLQAVFGSLTASLNYRSRGWVRFRRLWFAVLCTFIGAGLGAWAVQRLDPGLLGRLLPLLLLGFALWYLVSPRVPQAPGRRHLSLPLYALTLGTGIGFYDGFFGPGTGSFFALTGLGLLGLPLGPATAQAKVLNFTSNLAALIAFILGGQVLWGIGLGMASGQILGAWTGSHLAIRHGDGFIRAILTLVAVVISVKLLIQA